MFDLITFTSATQRRPAWPSPFAGRPSAGTTLRSLLVCMGGGESLAMPATPYMVLQRGAPFVDATKMHSFKIKHR